MATSSRRSRPPWLVGLLVLAAFVGVGILGRWVQRDPTGRAVGEGRGCGAGADDIDERTALVEELDAILIERDPWLLPQPPTNGDWSAFPQVPANPLSDAKIALGKAIFFEPGISVAGYDQSQEWSCATCHDPLASFGSGTLLGRGIGAGGEGRGVDRKLKTDAQKSNTDMGFFNERRAVNVAWSASVGGWQGDFDSVNGLGPDLSFIQDGLEGAEMFVDVALRSHGAYEAERVPETSVLLEEEYRVLLADAFPELAPGERPNRRAVTLAVTAYVRSITTWDAPFQRFLRMDDAEPDAEFPMSNAALRGAVVFFGVGRCTMCHAAPALGAARFETLGTLLYDPNTEIPGYAPRDAEGENGWGTLDQYYDRQSDNRGRYRATGNEDDLGGFLVPSVYGAGNVNVLAFGHGAAHDNLADFLAHKTGGSDPTKNTTLDPDLLEQLSPILFASKEPYLDDEQIMDLVAFIEEGLEDAGLAARHAPAGNLSVAGFCSPNNDAASRAATPGCENARASDLN